MAKIKHLAFEKFLALHLKKAGKLSARLSHKMESKRFNRLERLRYLASLADITEAQTTLPLTIGREVSLTQYGVLGHSFMQSRSLEELFQNIHRNLWVLDPNNRSGLTFRKVDREFQLIYPEPPIWPELPYFFLDLFFSALLQQSRELSGWPLEELCLYLNRPKPENELHSDLLNINVVYGAIQNYLSLPIEVLQKPFAMNRALTSPLYREHCNALLLGMKREGDLVERVRQQLLLFPPQQTTADEIANSLGMSGRTLRRKLNAESTSFRTVQQEILLHLSMEYLLETPLPVADIAHFLGYHDMPTYNRAFRKLTGSTPAAFRKEKIQ